MNDHDPKTCLDVTCQTCLDGERQESVIRLETALMDVESSAEGAEGEWVDMPVIVDALDVRNVLDLLRD